MRSVDLTAEARIRAAALELFAEQGTDATSIRSVAERADVSPALVIHHYGSKAGLIDAVDQLLIDRVEHILAEFAATASAGEASSAMAAIAREPEILAYLARAVGSGGEAGARLFDRLLDISEEFLQHTTAIGLTRQVPDTRAAAILLLIVDLGLLLVRPHVARALGTDPYSPAGLTRIVDANLDLLTEGLMRYDAGPASDANPTDDADQPDQPDQPGPTGPIEGAAP